VASSKGQVFGDVAFLVVVLLAAAIFFGSVYLIISDFNTEFQNDSDLPQQSKDIFDNINTNFPLWWDNAFVFLLIGLWGGILITSFFIDSHPVFFVIAFIGLIFVFVAGMIIANTYGDVAGDAGFDTAFPKVSWVFDHLLITIIMVGFSALIALYAKNQVGP
jgi:hypothetical protein